MTAVAYQSVAYPVVSVRHTERKYGFTNRMFTGPKRYSLRQAGPFYTTSEKSIHIFFYKFSRRHNETETRNLNCRTSATNYTFYLNTVSAPLNSLTFWRYTK